MASEVVDLTYLIDDDFEPPEQAKSYADEIPSGRIAYSIFKDKISSDVMSLCNCGNNCSNVLMRDPYIVKRIQHLRADYYMSKQGNERTNKTLKLVRSTVCFDDNGRRFHNFEGTIICKKKWLDVLGISKATYYRALELVKNDVYQVDSMRKATCSNVRGLDACGFLDYTISKYADYSPEREKLLLPPCITRKFLFDEYLTKAGPHIKIKHFYNLFNIHFGKKVSFAKTRNINPCNICMKAKNELHKIKDEEERKQLKEDLRIHLERQRERQDYYKKRNEAIMRPSEALSIIVDGMDQSKTSLPHFKGWCRAKNAALAVKTHVTGTIVHGRKNNFFIDMQQWPHDPNLTMTCIVNSLCGIGINHLPPKLYIQCDNCGRENKNKYVLGFLAYLCLAGYVREVFLSFLVKGHTHEDIDQRFSTISRHLRNVDAKTLPELEDALRETFHQRPYVESLGTMWDVKSWIADSLNEIQNHSFPHQFWMYCDRPGHVVLKSRLWSTDEWLPKSDADELELLAYDSLGDQLFPSGVPVKCAAAYDKINTELVTSIIEKMRVHLTYEEYTWWQTFTQNPDISVKKVSRWPLLNLERIHRIEDIPDGIAVERHDTCISDLLAEEETSREVITKRKKNRHV